MTGVSFRDKGLLDLALVHSSYLNERPGAFPESNERLEFLGDACLGLTVAEELYRRYPDWPEGNLTSARSVLVRGESLADIATRLDLGRFMYMGRGEEAGGGRDRPTNLAAAFEALVGALLLDQGYEAARDFVLKVLTDSMTALDERVVHKDPKSALQEVVQARGQAPPVYHIVGISGLEHARQFTAEVAVAGEVMGRGTGTRKSEAEQRAAGEALRRLEKRDADG